MEMQDPGGHQSRACPYPQDLSGDVRDPVLLERVPLGIFHQVCDGPRPTELHHQLRVEAHTVTHSPGAGSGMGTCTPKSLTSVYPS